jgi:hypothetical protein
MQLVQASNQLLVSLQTQEDTPTNTDDAAEDRTVFEGNKGKADDGDKRPELLTGKQKREEVLGKMSMGRIGKPKEVGRHTVWSAERAVSTDWPFRKAMPTMNKALLKAAPKVWSRANLIAVFLMLKALGFEEAGGWAKVASTFFSTA